MSISEIRAKLNARIWQAIAQSGVDVSAVPQTEMDQLVEVITDNVLLMMDDVLEEVGGDMVGPVPGFDPDAQGSDQERILWEGRPLLSLTEHYRVTSDRIRITRGLLGKEREDIELVRVQDIDQKQNIAERVLNVGDIFIRSHDPSQPEVVLRNLTDPLQVHEIIRQAVVEARKKHRLYYREEM